MLDCHLNESAVYVLLACCLVLQLCCACAIYCDRRRIVSRQWLVFRRRRRKAPARFKRWWHHRPLLILLVLYPSYFAGTWYTLVAKLVHPSGSVMGIHLDVSFAFHGALVMLSLTDAMAAPRRASSMKKMSNSLNKLLPAASLAGGTRGAVMRVLVERINRITTAIIVVQLLFTSCWVVPGILFCPGYQVASVSFTDAGRSDHHRGGQPPEDRMDASVAKLEYIRYLQSIWFYIGMGLTLGGGAVRTLLLGLFEITITKSINLARSSRSEMDSAGASSAENIIRSVRKKRSFLRFEYSVYTIWFVAAGVAWLIGAVDERLASMASYYIVPGWCAFGAFIVFAGSRQMIVITGARPKTSVERLQQVGLPADISASFQSSMPSSSQKRSDGTASCESFGSALDLREFNKKNTKADDVGPPTTAWGPESEWKGKS